MEKEETRDLVLSVLAQGLRAQLRLIARLRREGRAAPPPRARLTNVEMAQDVVTRAGHALHIREIAAAIRQRHGATVKPTSLTSSLIKCARRKQFFVLTGPNTFGLLGRDE